jgi:hypothetical protein
MQGRPSSPGDKVEMWLIKMNEVALPVHMKYKYVPIRLVGMSARSVETHQLDSTQTLSESLRPNLIDTIPVITDDTVHETARKIRILLLSVYNAYV